jgi:hypothetical protein
MLAAEAALGDDSPGSDDSRFAKYFPFAKSA